MRTRRASLDRPWFLTAPPSCRSSPARRSGCRSSVDREHGRSTSGDATHRRRRFERHAGRGSAHRFDSPRPSLPAYHPRPCCRTSPISTRRHGRHEVGARRVADVMLPPASIKGTATVDEAFRLMHARHLSGLYVVDDADRPTAYLDLLELSIRYLEALRQSRPAHPQRTGGRVEVALAGVIFRHHIRAHRDGPRRQDRGRVAWWFARRHPRDRRSGGSVRRDRPERHLPARRDDDPRRESCDEPASSSGWRSARSSGLGGEPYPPAAHPERRHARSCRPFSTMSPRSCSWRRSRSISQTSCGYPRCRS